MEKQANKIPVGIVFMGRGLGELLELKARCRRRLDFLDKYRERISDYVYEKLRQEYSSYLEAVDGEVGLGLAEYEIKLSEIRLFSNQLRLLEKTHEEKIQELALRYALGEYSQEQYDRISTEHTERMKRFAETIRKYSGEERRLAGFLEKVAGNGMTGELKAELEQKAREAGQEEAAIDRSMDEASEAEAAMVEELAEPPAEPLEEPEALPKTGLEEEIPVDELRAGEPEQRLEDAQAEKEIEPEALPKTGLEEEIPVDELRDGEPEQRLEDAQAEKEIEPEAPAGPEISQEASLESAPEDQHPSAGLLVESIERVSDEELAEPAAIDTAPIEENPDLLEESPVLHEEAPTAFEITAEAQDEGPAEAEQEVAPASEEEALQPEAPEEEEQGEREMEPAAFAETEEDRIAATADLPDLQSLEEEQEEKAQLPLEDRSGAGESLSRQQESSPGTDLDAIFAEFSGQSTDTQAEQPAEPPVSEESPALNMLEETAPEPEEVLLEQAAAPLSEEEAGPEKSAVESVAAQALAETDLPDVIETGTEQTAGRAETGIEQASVDLDAIMNAAVTLSEDEEPPAEVPAGNSEADSETAVESLPEPAEQLAEEEKPEEPESAGDVEEALEELEQQPSPQTGEPAPLPEEQSAEKAEELIEEPGSPEPPSEEPVEPAEEQLPAGTIELQEEDIPEGEDERDFVAERVVSLDEKVELEFNLGEKADEAEKILTVDQTIDAIKKKTVECPKCGTKNYAIRWYCENCEATLTSL